MTKRSASLIRVRTRLAALGFDHENPRKAASYILARVGEELQKFNLQLQMYSFVIESSR